ncbi:hypothetical protein [Chitinophaga sp. CB10]|uniref:hypothetical protein n=1 Tax=Chitinophaga sp. CB10 TaxID=1891659 RepID=UPI0025BD49B7|nr:hypothetical protein [Chitinophaga sp. CB10]
MRPLFGNETFGEIKLSSTDLRDFFRFRGWQEVPAAMEDGLFLLTNPTCPNRQLVFPIDASAPIMQMQ